MPPPTQASSRRCPEARRDWDKSSLTLPFSQPSPTTFRRHHHPHLRLHHRRRRRRHRAGGGALAPWPSFGDVHGKRSTKEPALESSPPEGVMSPATAEARHRLLRLLRLSQATAAQRIRSVASRSRAKNRGGLRMGDRGFMVMMPSAAAAAAIVNRIQFIPHALCRPTRNAAYH